MDEEREEMRGTAGDLGGHEALIAEYDLAESPGPEGGEGTPLDEGEGATRMLVAGTAEGERIDIRGVVGMARAQQKAKVTGVSVVTVGERTKVKGFTPLALASGDLKMKQAGALLAVGGKDVAVERGFVGFALAPHVEVRDGGRVLISAVSAAILGLAAGIGFGLVGLLGLSLMRRAFLRWRASRA